MRRLLLLVPLAILLVGCGSKSEGNGASELKGTTMDCEIGGDKSKAELANLDDGKTHQIVVDTNKGSFTFELATKVSPCTTASIAGLVEKGFFETEIGHRHYAILVHVAQEEADAHRTAAACAAIRRRDIAQADRDVLRIGHAGERHDDVIAAERRYARSGRTFRDRHGSAGDRLVEREHDRRRGSLPRLGRRFGGWKQEQRNVEGTRRAMDSARRRSSRSPSRPPSSACRPFRWFGYRS